MWRVSALAALALAGCGDKPAAPVADASAAQAVLDGYLKQHGANLDSCFDGAPAMAGPGTPQSAPGAAPAATAINRLVVAIDASGSMAAKSGGVTKMDAARRAAAEFLGGVPEGTQVGLVVFGHRGTNQASGKPASCAGVETVYPLGGANTVQLQRALQSVQATGWTPLAAAIAKAGSAFSPSDTPGAQVVYVVSDGLETCGGDPVAAARALHGGPVKAVVNIIGFDLAAADRAQLQAVAGAGGGVFVETQASALSQMLGDLYAKAGKVSAITRERFDAGGRTTDNNLAAGRYVTKVNQCLSQGSRAESAGLSQALAAQAPDVRDGALELLRRRHDRYLARAQQIADTIEANRAEANDAIGNQTKASERRLGQ